MTTDVHDFVGNPNAYAQQGADGSYIPIRSELTEEAIQQHISKKVSIGTYVVWYDKARMFVFDIDQRDLAMARSLAKASEAKGFHPGIEFSGRKGYHVWVLFDKWLPAANLMAVAKSIAAECGFTGEVYPKQGSVRDLGSLIKLPLGVHAVSGDDSKFITEPHVDTEATLDAAFSTIPVVVPPPASGGIQPCVASIQTNPPMPGERNILYFHLACWLRRMGLLEDAIEILLTGLWKDAAPGEISRVVRNSEFSGPMCDSMPAERHCGEACVKFRSRKGLSIRPGQMRHAVVGELVVVGAGKKSGQVVDIIHPDIVAAKVQLRKDS